LLVLQIASAINDIWKHLEVGRDKEPAGTKMLRGGQKDFEPWTLEARLVQRVKLSWLAQSGSEPHRYGFRETSQHRN
jgi:hypothetical protein